VLYGPMSNEQGNREKCLNILRVTLTLLDTYSTSLDDLETLGDLRSAMCRTLNELQPFSAAQID
jgi:hypothetical protein